MREQSAWLVKKTNASFQLARWRPVLPRTCDGVHVHTLWVCLDLQHCGLRARASKGVKRLQSLLQLFGSCSNGDHRTMYLQAREDVLPGDGARLRIIT